MKRYTHFVDRPDGTGYYRDYDHMGRVLRRHSEAVRNPRTSRSWVKEYDPETGDEVRVLADWHRPAVAA
jgi:hypothetical protein